MDHQAARHARWLLALSVWALLAGCATDARQVPLTEAGERQKAEFYWPYAALAADVYRTRGEADAQVAMALASPWLRTEMANSTDQRAKERYKALDYPEAEQLYRERLHERCMQERAALGDALAAEAALPSCRAEADAEAAAQRAADEVAAEPNRFTVKEPQSKEDCEYTPTHEPAVPLETLKRESNWSRVPELQKQAPARGWRLFVPELAIEVWRRKREAPADRLVIEYAIVYRGTVGGGGWVSNLRGLTAMMPFVWDQYRQAQQATQNIVEQIDRLHAISDDLMQRPEPTQVLFTAVGHSLGGGLAKFIYLRVPRVTRVVAFDPSPIDGSAIIPVDARDTVTDHGRRVVDADPRDPRAAMHLLFEDGEFISEIAPCHSGPIWGDEGGPWVRCERVNLSRGNTFRQHNMAQLACKLYLVRQGLPAR